MELNNLKYEFYVDLDGVVADLERKIEELTGHKLINKENDRANPQDNEAWLKFIEMMKNGRNLFEELDLMPDAMELWNYIKPYKPNILTACGRFRPDFVAGQKKVWVKANLDNHNKIYTVVAGRNKAKFAHPQAILIDDKQKCVGPWAERGGIGILHTSAANTINELKKLGL